MRLSFPATITDIVSQNSSFDACMIRVMYTGKNRNKTAFSKESVERAIPTIYNCPIVCNYNIEDDTIGGHDVDVVMTDKGIRIINLTDAIGVIPYGAEYHWEEVKDGDETHEYLCIGGVLWKRTPAYEKIKRDGISGQSMEINVENAKTVEGYYEIEDFSFTAFCILGDDVTPCFESASIETFSLAAYKKNIARMMEDFKREYSTVITASADDIDRNSLKGGEGKLKVDELMAKYGLSAEDVNFSTDGISIEEIEERFAEISRQKKFADGDGENGSQEEGGSQSGAGSQEAGAEQESGGSAASGGDAESGNGSGGEESGGDNGGDTQPDDNDEDDASGQVADVKTGKKHTVFAMTGEQFLRELTSVLRAEMVYDECWECNVPRYWYIDYDSEASEVYAEDRTDNHLYGMKYAMNGDAIVIDFASKKRKKIMFADFDDGENDGIAVFACADEIVKERFAAMEKEMSELREFKRKEIEKQTIAEREAKFAEFEDLNGNEAFIHLKENCDGLTADQIEEKCYAIRGRCATVKFSAASTSTVRIPVENATRVGKDEPYGGVFVEYGVGQ